MNFGQRTPEKEALALVERALAEGLRVFDTANMYGDGAAERLLGRALATSASTPSEGNDVVVVSKAGAWRKGGKSEGLGRQTLLDALKGSLERLRRPRLDLYLLHTPDPLTPPDETVDGLAQALEEGLIQAWGVSNFSSWQILELIHLCERRNIAGPSVAQQLYNPLVRQLDVEFFSFAKKYKLHTGIYNPLAGGLLVGRGEAPRTLGPRLTSNAFYKKRYGEPRLAEFASTLRGIAAEAGLSLQTMTYAWLASHPRVDSFLLGPATVAHLDDALAALSVELSSSTLRAMDSAYRCHLGTDASYAR